MSACNKPRTVRNPYSLTTLPHRNLDSEIFRTTWTGFLPSARVVKGLKKLRIGAIGARPAAFNTVRYSEKILESAGISVETLDLSELWEMAGSRTTTAKFGAPQGHSPSSLDEQHSGRRARQMAKLGTVIDTWIADTEVTSAPFSAGPRSKNISAWSPARS